MAHFQRRFVQYFQSNSFIKIITPIIAVILALIISSIPILLDGKNPIEAYQMLIVGAFGNPIRIGDTLTRATPIMLTGLGAAISFKSGHFNVGGEGQLYMGALGATLVALTFQQLPAILLVPLSFIAAFIMGGLWSLIPGLLKAYRKVNEIIVTIMMNFIAFWIISYLVHGPLEEPGAEFSYTYEIASAAKLPVLIQGTQFNLGYVIALMAIVITYIVINKSSLGFQMRACGGNMEAAHYAGMNTNKILLFVFFVSGGLAGLGGALEILGVQYRLSSFFSPGYGWDGVGVALIGNLSIVGVFFASKFFAMLRSGSGVMERRMRVPSSIGNMIQGMAIFITISMISYVLLKQQDKVIGSKSIKNDNQENKSDKESITLCEQVVD